MTRRIVIPAAVLGQVWRGDEHQTRLAAFLKARHTSPVVYVEPLDARLARWACELCAVRGTADVIDASVVVCACLHRHAVLTSDPRDMRKLADNLRLIAI